MKSIMLLLLFVLLTLGAVSLYSAVLPSNNAMPPPEGLPMPATPAPASTSAPVSASTPAPTSATPQKPVAAPASQDSAKAVVNVYAIMAGCELNNECLLGMLSQVVKTDPNPLYLALLSQLQAKKEQIAFETENCDAKEIVETKRVIAACMGELVKKANASNNINAMDVKEDENVMNDCIKLQLKPLAAQANLYAQTALVSVAKREHDAENEKYWNSMIQVYSGNPQFDLYQRCSAQFQFLSVSSIK